MPKITDSERQRIEFALANIKTNAPTLAIAAIHEPKCIILLGDEFYADLGNSQTYSWEITPRMWFTGQERHRLYERFGNRVKVYRHQMGDWMRDSR